MCTLPACFLVAKIYISFIACALIRLCAFPVATRIVTSGITNGTAAHNFHFIAGTTICNHLLVDV